MDVAEHLTLCENVLNESLNDSKKHPIKSFQEKGDAFVLQVTNGEDDFTFNFHLIPKGEEAIKRLIISGEDSQRFYYDEEGNMFVEIKDIAVKGYSSVDFQEMDLPHMKAVLKTLAHQHAKQIEEFDSEITLRSPRFYIEKYNSFVNNILDLLTEANIDNIDRDLLKEGITTLISTSEKALQMNENILYVKGNIFQKRLFFKDVCSEYMQCKMLNIGPGIMLPLVYDALLVIFYFGNRKMIQENFHKLTKYFYDALDENLREVNIDISTILPVEKYELRIKKFIPYVKLEIAHYYYQQLNRSEENRKEIYKSLLCSLIFELYYCVLYPNLTREDCYEIVRNRTGSSEYVFLDYKLIPLEERAGFMGDYFRVKINIRRADINETFHLFAKYVATTNDTLVDTALAIFRKEEFIYRTFTSKLAQLGLEEITDFLPKCYFIRTNDVLVFEDMSEYNYHPLDSREPLSYINLQAAVKSIAKLHASSLLYEEKTKLRIDQEYSEFMEEKFFVRNLEKYDKFIATGVRSVVDCILDEFPEIPKKLTMEAFKQRALLIFEDMCNKAKKSDKYRNSICHGDFWTANMLFKEDSNDENITCCLLDYQFIRYCPPTHDLLCLFYINTNKYTRDNYMWKLIDEYYNELGTILQKYGSDINEIYPYNKFIECCEYMKSQSICQAAVYYQTSLCPDFIKTISTDPEKFGHYCLVDRSDALRDLMKSGFLKIRFKEIVEDLYDICEKEVIKDT